MTSRALPWMAAIALLAALPLPAQVAVPRAPGMPAAPPPAATPPEPAAVQQGLAATAAPPFPALAVAGCPPYVGVIPPGCTGCGGPIPPGCLPGATQCLPASRVFVQVTLYSVYPYPSLVPAWYVLYNGLFICLPASPYVTVSRATPLLPGMGYPVVPAPYPVVPTSVGLCWPQPWGPGCPAFR